MNNTEKILRAFIEASGFDIEEEYIPLDYRAIPNWNNNGRIGERPTPTIDYKVTKKPSDKRNISASEKLSEATARMGQR